MVKKFITFVVSVAFLWLQVAISHAENIHYSAFENMRFSNNYSNLQSRGVTGQFGFRIPFGAKDRQPKESYYGFKLTYGQNFNDSNPFKYGKIRNLNLLESRFNKNGLRNFKLANYEFYDYQDRNYIFGNGNGNGFGNGNGNLIMIFGAIALVAGVCWAAGCFDSDSDNNSSSSSSSN